MERLKSVVSRFRPFAVAIVAVCAACIAPSALAQGYTPTAVTPEALFDWSALALVVLGLMGAALAAVAGYKIAIGIGLKVIRYFGGRAG